MTQSFFTQWTIERGEDDAFDVCLEYTFLSGHPGVLSGPPEHCSPPEAGEVEIISVWRKADENDPQAPEFPLTDDEREKIELWIIENPPEPDYPEDY